MTFGLVLVVLLLYLPNIIGLVFTGGGNYVIDPVLQDNLPLVITSLLMGIGLNIVLLWKGEWTTLTRAAKIAVNLFVLFVLYVLVAGHTQWLAAFDAQGLFSIFKTIPAEAPMPREVALALVMWAFRLGFFVAMVVLALETVQLAYAMARQAVFPDDLHGSSPRLKSGSIL
jgi:hypothetical protein